KRIRLSYKLLALAGAIICTITLQLVKGALRKQTWVNNYSGSRVEAFQDALVEKTSNIGGIFSENAFFPVYARMNQGYNTAMVMRRIPQMQDYDKGRSIMISIAAAFVPRFVWPDKPESGGVYNMLYFAGYQLRGWSANIGPMGEAYGNFGITGGIIYMFFFGLFISWVYMQVIKISKRFPLLFLWIPLIFFETMYSMENDTLQALNSVLKSGAFLFVIGKMFPVLFRGPKNLLKAINENSRSFWNHRPGWSLPKPTSNQ
ncbi:MAG TPA: hypothetical protein VEB42_16860, partial [Chitinophagaceae bacterium]|nr:hypothetical protein [Chitinophagaceae bacterium]